MLDDLARELQKRGHHFVRYADDLRVHVKTELAGQRVREGVTGFVERRLKLKVNRRKFWVKHAARATVLVFGFEYRHDGGILIRVSPKALTRMRTRVRRLTGRSWRIAMPERIVLLNRISHRVERLLRPGRYALGLSGSGWLAAPSSPAGEMEGVEAPPDSAAQPAGARDAPPRGL
jgi:hypothetical protein